MFDNYKLGIATAPIPVLPIPHDVYDTGVKAGKVWALAKRVPGIVGYYQIGCANAAVPIGGLGILQMGPGELLDEIKLLNGEIVALGKELETHRERLNCAPTNLEGECGKLNQFLRGPWTEFVNSWVDYRVRHESWTSRAFADPNQLKRFRSRFKAMHEQASSIVVITSPSPSADPKGFFEKPANVAQALFGMMKTLVWLAAGVVGVLVILLGFQYFQNR